jgi:outer membrane protein assembly factor BamB
MQSRAWHLKALCVLALLSPSAAQAAWPTFGNGVDHRAHAAEPLAPPLAVLWKFASRPYQDAAIGTASPIINSGSPITVDNTVYFASKDRLYALDFDTGGEKWHWPTGEEVAPTIRSTPAVGDGMVYIGALDGMLYALDATTGSQRWAVKTGSSIRSHPLLFKESPGDPGTVYFGSDDDYFYAVDAQTGDIKWKYRATDDVVSAPCYEDGLIIFNSADSQIHALAANTGKPRWIQRSLVPALGISPVIFNGRVFLPSGTTLNTFRIRGGTPAPIQLYDPKTRQSALEGDVTTTPILADDPNGPGGPTSGFVFLGDRGGYFYSFHLNGKLRWKVKLDDRTMVQPVLAGNTLYVGSNKGFIYGINADTGEVTWRYRAEAPRDYQVRYASHNISAPLIVDGGRLLVLGDDGTLTAFSADAMDVTAPVITAPKPDRGSTQNGTPPLTITTYLWDEGSGINPATLAVTLDGQPLEMSDQPYDKKTGSAIKSGVVYDPVKRKLEYNTAPTVAGQKATPLPNGHHAVKIEVADWRGNIGTLEWTFIVDNTLPVKPKRPPTDPNNPIGTPGSMGPGGRPGAPATGAPGSRQPRPVDPRRRRR